MMHLFRNFLIFTCHCCSKLSIIAIRSLSGLPCFTFSIEANESDAVQNITNLHSLLTRLQGYAYIQNLTLKEVKAILVNGIKDISIDRIQKALLFITIPNPKATEKVMTNLSI